MVERSNTQSESVRFESGRSGSIVSVRTEAVVVQKPIIYKEKSVLSNAAGACYIHKFEYLWYLASNGSKRNYLLQFPNSFLSYYCSLFSNVKIMRIWIEDIILHTDMFQVKRETHYLLILKITKKRPCGNLMQFIRIAFKENAQAEFIVSTFKRRSQKAKQPNH